jgi:hypothetical protein
MEKYLLTISLLIWRVLPFQLRTPKQKAWLNALLSPIQYIHSLFFSFANEKRIEANLTGQTGVLEWWLNRKFNGGFEGIYINNVYFNILTGQSYVYFIAENAPAIYTKYLAEGGGTSGLYTSFISEFFSYGATFIIMIPAALNGVLDENELKAIVSQFVLADKTYELMYY